MTDLLIIGWDGASYNHVKDIDLEYFDSLDNGGKLLPEKIYRGMPIDSGYAWTSISTGLEVDEHGIMSLNNVVKSKKLLSLTKKISSFIPNNRLRTYFFYGINKFLNMQDRTPRSTDVPYKRLWDYWDGRTLSVAVPMTYPAWKHDGVMISGIPGPTDGEQPGAYPQRYEEHRKRFKGYYYLDDEGPLEAEHQPRKQEYIDAVYENNEEAINVTIEIAEEEDFSMVFAVFPVIDDLLHALDPEKEWEKIEGAYKWMDGKTRELVDSIEPDNVLIVSDHGMMDAGKSFNFSLPEGVLMDHDSMNGLWASNIDFDFESQADVVPEVLEEFGHEFDKSKLEIGTDASREDEEEIKKRLERMGYLER